MRVKILSGNVPERFYTVRLIGLDTPETKRPGVAVECGGKQATAQMLTATFSAPVDRDGDGLFDERGATGARVSLKTDRSQDLYDRYDRLLAFVDVTGDIPPAVDRTTDYDLAETQIAFGWGETYVYGKTPFARVKRYRAAASRARSARLGAWGSCAGDFHSAS